MQKIEKQKMIHVQWIDGLHMANPCREFADTLEYRSLLLLLEYYKWKNPIKQFFQKN
jgi:hypothetical protein